MDWKLRLKSNGGPPLYRQLEAAIRAAIRRGALAPGERIPSVAELADRLKISKLTALKAFQQLEQAGLLRSEVGRGSFVAANGEQSAGLPAAEPKPEVARSIRRLREGYAGGLRELMAVERRPATIDLAGGVPSPATIPDGLLEKLARQALARDPRRLYQYAGPAGLAELREALAAALTRGGVPVAADELIVTNGSQQAVSLAALWAREEGRAALCETPTYTGVPASFMLLGHAVQSIGWERGAPSLGQLEAAGGGRRTLLYLCPDFHNPSGDTVAGEVRQRLALWVRRNDCVVIDDQIFRDLRFEGQAPPPLYSLLPPGRRILVGSISKSFMTGLRVGFLAADHALIAEMMVYKRYMDLGGPSLMQAMAAAFLADGYARHLDKMRAYYRARRDAALSALAEYMPAGVAWTRPQGGFQLWVTMAPGSSSIQLFLQGIEHGVAITPGPAHDIDGRYLNCFRLGYGQSSPEEIRTAVARLAAIVEKLAAGAAADRAAGGLGMMV